MVKRPGRATSPSQAHSSRTLVICSRFHAKCLPSGTCILLSGCLLYVGAVCLGHFYLKTFNVCHYLLMEKILISMQESSMDDIAEVTSKMSTIQLDKVSASPPALKLPQLFTLTPNSSGKSGNMQKRYTSAPQTYQVENLSERKSLERPLSSNLIDNLPQGFLLAAPCSPSLFFCVQ